MAQAVVALALVVLPATVRAQTPSSAEESPLAWHWRRQHPVDYGAAAVFGAIALATELAPHSDDTRWQGGIAFDDEVRDAFVLGNFDDRKIAARVSDATISVLAAHTVLIDAVLVAWAGHGNGDTAWQMAAIDVEAMAFTVAFTGAIKRAAERERPSGTACRTDSQYDRRCVEQSSDGSFFSGHTSLAFTAAGLTCVHHMYLPLYGRAGDKLACAAASLLATSVAAERVLADRHYATDVLVGGAVGAFSGAVMPWALFYAHPTTSTGVAWSLSPQPGADEGGLGLRGLW
jgi:membrane-associated phospholipid phosphatase